MPKNLGNFIGFSTDGWTNTSVPLSGIWNIFDQARNARVNRWPGISVLEATGGTEITSPLGKYHVFTSPGNFIVTNALASSAVDVLIVAGGGGAGNPLAGGGGAGGVVRHSAFPITGPGTFPITVGAGGAGSSASTPASGPAGFKGSNSTAFGMTADGGGGGGPYDGSVPNLPAMSGGSGGGGRTYTPPLNGGTGTQPTFNTPFTPNGNFSQYGNPGGGSPVSSDPQGRGGGGAASSGVSGPYTPGTITGGNGQPFPNFAGSSFSPVFPAPTVSEIGPTGLYGGGGAAGSRNEPSLGGPGGGGDSGPGAIGQPGFQYTGGGGGGGLYSPSFPTVPTSPPTASGGSGIVIIRIS